MHTHVCSMTTKTRVCRKCGRQLIIGENIAECNIRHRDYICQTCATKHRRTYQRDYNNAHREHKREYQQAHLEHIRENHREWSHRTGRRAPMGENRNCSMFIGVHVAERVLSHVFKDVHRMPYNNPGFDFRCRFNKMIDVKCSCRVCRENHADRWQFSIKQNVIADFFLCLAVNNRVDLEPEHIWLIPAEEINDHVSVSISETTLDKWRDYEQPIGRVISCCNRMKEGGIP